MIRIAFVAFMMMTLGAAAQTDPLNGVWKRIEITPELDGIMEESECMDQFNFFENGTYELKSTCYWSKKLTVVETGLWVYSNDRLKLIARKFTGEARPFSREEYLGFAVKLRGNEMILTLDSGETHIFNK